jgi:hypothetical protein
VTRIRRRRQRRLRHEKYDDRTRSFEFDRLTDCCGYRAIGGSHLARRVYDFTMLARITFHRTIWPVLAAVALTMSYGEALAQGYPVSGKWTYENAAAAGPAQDCGKRFMDFQGARRFDKGGSVPDYRNLSAEQSGGNEYRLTDEFYTGQIHGRTNYTLQKRDENHIELRMSGKTIPLRRCE